MKKKEKRSNWAAATNAFAVKIVIVIQRVSANVGQNFSVKITNLTKKKKGLTPGCLAVAST